MRTTELFLDGTDAHLVHASPTCSHNEGVLQLAERADGEQLSDLDELLAALSADGRVVPAWSARGLRYCPHCTLVATSDWAVAA
jgi:hypothetical protein